MAELVAKKTRVPVTERALVQRINRRLGAKDPQAIGSGTAELLRKSRGWNASFELGEYYLLNVTGNYIADKHVDLEELGRECGALAEYEYLAEDN